MFLKLGAHRHLEQEDLGRFLRLYDYRHADQKPFSSSKWDERADSWEKAFRSGKGPARKSLDRVQDTVRYLCERGVLDKNCEVVDVGCGPGRFVAGFAEVGKSATGIDISPRMIGYAEKYARELQLGNTRFLACDFQQLDIEKAGLAGAYDLAFCSITPAASGVAGAKKLMQMSRSFCFTSNFVSTENHLEKQMGRELFDGNVLPKWDAHWFYALFNMLFLTGYFPEVRYYSRHKEAPVLAERDAARRHMYTILPQEQHTAENEEKILRWLETQLKANPALTETSDFTYAWMLWNINDKVDRQVYPAHYQ